MKVRLTGLLVFAMALALAAAADDYLSVKRKIDGIESGRLKPGARVELTPRELNAYAEHEVPEGVRNPKLEITAAEIATGSAQVDFSKLARAQGWQAGRLLAMLLSGERPVSVTVRIRSAGGQATVDVQRVAISGIAIDGTTLDFLIRNVLLPLYPDAVVGRPFDLGSRIERLDIQPRGVGVVIGR